MSMVDEKLAAALHDSDDEDSHHDSDAEVDHGAITKQGLGEVSGEKDKKSKPVWYALVQGTLFWYKSQSFSQLKGDLQLKGSSIEHATKPQPHSLVIKVDGKVQLVMGFTDADLAKEWEAALTSARDVPAGDPPSKSRGKSLSMGARMKKATAGKMATSSAGKAMAKATINEEAKLLISAVKNLITETYDSKTANTVENNIIKIFVKYHYLMTEGQIEEDAWTTMDKGLREAFKWGVKITDNVQSGRHIPPETMTEWIGLIKKALKEVEKKLFELMQPHVQAKTLSRISGCFTIFCSEDFLRAIFSPKKVKASGDSDSLTYAMERYLQFSW
eukprot:comp9388_c0_seq1/m.4438 comp9388_c0_seq1/g.4438  ORF comp9388_c0_seq1/g.4438 comp9388_c0_seq1/m.4438 type:complete len:331 (-) comp9388_c0_seq1:191-1183(-)